MSENFNLEIVNPEKSFFKKDNVIEAIIPAFEGEMGIFKGSHFYYFFLEARNYKSDYR